MRPSVPDTASLNLIRTKFYRPVVGRDLVHRARLIDLLENGKEFPLTLVSAPAGSGKTTMLGDWLTSCSSPSAWLSLDNGDSDPGVFLRNLIVAIRTIVPEACQQTLALLQAAELPPRRFLASTLINEIEDLRDDPALQPGRRFVLVLDDYHLATGQDVNELLSELLRHPLQAMRLVLATRSDPALPLTNLRARGQVLEIRRHDLRFSTEETRAFLDRTIASPVTESGAVILTEQMEGWIAGLRLVALNLRHISDPDAFLVNLRSVDRYVMDYLLDEVLSLQPPAIQEFLFKTSILARLSGPLCEAVTGLGDQVCNGQAYLEWLEQANLFVIALDNQRQWYRYHHLFSQLLRGRLERQADAGQIADLHRRASAWFAGNGYVEEAIAHALHAGDDEVAVEIVEAHRHDAINQERWQQLEHWLRLMPPRLIEKTPELLLLECWLLQRQWRMTDISPQLDRIEALIEVMPPTEPRLQLWRAEIDAFRSLVCYYAMDEASSITFGRRALQTLPMAYSAVRGLALSYYVGGMQAMGDIQGARKALDEGLKEDRFHRNAFAARVLIPLCLLNWILADLSGLNQAAAYFVKIAGERNLIDGIGWARYLRGCAAYQANKLAAAEQDFAAVVEQRYLAYGVPFSQSAFGLASIWQAQGASDRAAALIETVISYALENNNTAVMENAQAFRAWLAARQGRNAEAQRWADTLDIAAPLPPMTAFFVAPVSLVKVLLDQPTAANRSKAAAMLTRLQRKVEATGNLRFKIEVMALQALLSDAEGDQQAALHTLREAVMLAEPGGLLRVFVDLGTRMAELLVCLGLQDGASDWLERILRAFPASKLSGTATARPRGGLPAQSAAVNPLTMREIEVLELLVERLSAKEIAQRLVISDGTAKRHTANIYQKLGVNSRREAVAMAMALGILFSQL